MTAKVGVVGASGYGGAELVRLLAGHARMHAAVVVAHRHAGEPIAALFPNLAADQVLDAVDVDQLASLDLVFLATPHGIAAELAGDLVDAGTKVVDVSGAHRLDAESFEIAYGEPHPRPELTPAIYGLTEFNRAAVADAALVANPGCYPTAALLALLPLASLIDVATIIVDAKSGTSGAGRGLRDHLHHATVSGDLVAYGAPDHRHKPEIAHGLKALAGVEATVTFTPHLIDMPRGLLATCYANVDEGVSTADLQDALVDSYGHEPFVSVLAPGTFPHTKALHGSNGAQVSAVHDTSSGKVIATCAIDNLGKGAAGQAIQNANLMLGIPETMGLTPLGVFP